MQGASSTGGALVVALTVIMVVPRSNSNSKMEQRERIIVRLDLFHFIHDLRSTGIYLRDSLSLTFLETTQFENARPTRRKRRVVL